MIRASAPRRVQFLAVVACFAVLTTGAAPRPGAILAQPRPETQPVEPSPAAADPPPAVAAPVEGFRQARFGMTEPEVRQAIRRDFPTAAGRLARTTHPSERTTVLAVTVEELLPAGSAQLFYVLGYASKRLVQVNIVWISDGRSTARDEAIVAAANTLRDHFQAQHQSPHDKVLMNQQVGENAFIVFRATQPDRRMVALVLSGVAAAGRADRPPAPPPLTLQLSYIRDHERPDVFRIERGRF